MATAAATRYARALADVAAGPGFDPEQTRVQLREVEQMVTGSPELLTAMHTPAIQTSRKRAAMGKLLDQMGVSQLIRNFIFVIIDHRRIALLPQIREAFDLEMDQRQGFERGNVTSTETLTPAQSAALEAELSRLSGKRIKLSFAVDPELLGGALARIGSTVYDGSVRGQLESMRRQLMGHAAEYQVET
jgi:F-type H+-transporting ATPase subunit delta